MTERSKVEFLECENKLLLYQQSNYKELCKVLTERHVEIVKYLNSLKDYVEKMMGFFHKENVLYSNYLNDKTLHESNIDRYDKQIQDLSQSIQSSKAQILDKAENFFKDQINPTINLTTSVNNHSIQVSRDSSNGNLKRFTCNYYDCSEVFTSESLLDSHMRTHHGTSFHTSTDLLNFNKKMNEALFAPATELEVLDYNSTSYSSITDHDNHNNFDNKTARFRKLIACEYCGKYFNKHYLESHKRSHTGIKPYKCSVDGCNRTFTQTSSRNFHEKRFHRIDRTGQLKCSFLNCDVSFESIGEMQKHTQQHQVMINTLSHSLNGGFKEEPEPPLVAKTSHARSHNGSVARARARSTNNYGNKHVCNQCGKSFAYKVALKQHALMHGDKNFRCPYGDCNYASYWKHNLGLHLKKHHENVNQ